MDPYYTRWMTIVPTKQQLLKTIFTFFSQSLYKTPYLPHMDPKHSNKLKIHYRWLKDYGSLLYSVVDKCSHKTTTAKNHFHILQSISIQNTLFTTYYRDICGNICQPPSIIGIHNPQGIVIHRV